MTRIGCPGVEEIYRLLGGQTAPDWIE